MQLIHSVITINLIFITLYSYGFFISDKILKKNKTDFFFKIFVGYIFVGSLALALHFFIKISSLVSILFILFSFIIYLKNFSEIYNKNHYLLLFFITFISLIIYGYSDHPIDSNMYHHPYISYLKYEKIIFGIANIQFRFGHISFLQYAQSILSNNLFHYISLASINIIFYISFIYYLSLKIFEIKKFNLIFLITVLLGSFLLIKFSRYREYGNDLIPLLISIYFLIQILEVKNKYFSRNDLINLSFLFVVFMFVHKVSYIFASLIFLVVYKHETFKLFKKIKLSYLFISLLIFILWTAKNLITTSCIVYPLEFTCINNSLFQLIGAANPSNAAWLTEIWAKGFIDHPNWESLNLENYAKGFNWVSTWFKGHFVKILEILSPLFFIILLSFLYILKNKKIFQDKQNTNNEKIKYINIWITLFIGLFIWFYNAPIYRYGSFYIISIICITYIIILEHFNLKNITKKIIFFKIIFILCILFFLTKNILRISKSELSFFPKTLNENKTETFDLQKNYNLKLLNTTDSLCYYTKFICSHEIPKNIKIKKIKNYYIIDQ